MVVIKREESNFVKEHISEGTQQMVISGVFDLGLQKIKKYKSEETELVHQVVILFETQEYYEEGNFAGKPKKIYSQRFRLSMQEKAAFYKFIKSLYGDKIAEDAAKKGLDIYKLLKKNAFVTVGRFTKTNGDEIDVIENYSSLPAKIEKIEPEELIIDGSEAVPKWIKDLQEIGRKNAGIVQEQEASDELDDILNDEPIVEVAKSTKTAPVKARPAVEPAKAKNMASANREKRDASINEIFGDQEEEASDLPTDDTNDAGDFL